MSALPTKQAASQGIPVLDFSDYLAGKPGAASTLATEIASALEQIGFMLIVGHDVPQSLIDRTFAQAHRFHAQPLARKLDLRMNDANNGYMAQGQYAIVTSEHNVTDQPEGNEAFFVKRERAADDPQVQPGRRLAGPNLWPDNLPGFKDTVLEYAYVMDDFAMRCLPVLAESLGMPADHFTERFQCSQFSVRLSHYPPGRGGANQFGIAPHSDANFMTFLPQSAVPGLQVRMPGGHWTDIPDLPGSFAVNSGDTLRRWSNGQFKSTPHRALPPTHEHRYAVPYFLGPNIDALIECLPTCTTADSPPRWEPITYEDWMLYWYDQNYNYEKQLGADTQ
jgi:isopenicillin N synthase-like dioxygenase